MSELLNLFAAAKVMGYSVKDIRQMIADGMPVHQTDDGQQRFIVSEMVSWLVMYTASQNKETDESKITATEAKRRREVALALTAELELATKRGQLVEMDVAMSEFGRALVDVRAALTSQSSRLPGLLAHKDEDTIAELLDADNADILEKLSEYVHHCEEPINGESDESFDPGYGE